MISEEQFEEFVAKEISDRIAARSGIFIKTGATFAREYKPLEYVIDGILPKGTLTTITGPGNVGKTALGMLISGCVVNGQHFAGREVKQGHVLYASAENTTDFRHRYIAMRDNWKSGRFNENRFHVLTATEKGGLTASAGEIALYATYLKIAFEVVIVDTQAAWSPVEDEANNQDQLAYARALRHLCLLPGSPAVLVLSHPTKNPTKAEECRPRGGVAFENETDGNWTMWANGGDLVEVAYTRLRVPPWLPFSVRMRQIETTTVFDANGRSLRSVQAEIATAEEAKAANGAKPIKKAKWELALGVLDNTLADYPCESPNRKQYPTDRTLTRVERFRQALVSAGIIDTDTNDNGRGAWRDIKKALLEKGYIRIEGDLCWRIVC
jgi:hypothetical protein